MVDNSWLKAFQVFLWGFSGVFLTLIILMYCTKAITLISAVIHRRGKEKEKKERKKI